MPSIYDYLDLAPGEGFIGNPDIPGSNRFNPDVPINGISGWTGTLTPEQVARLPWNAGVQPAGGAYDLPGGNPQAAIDFQESTGGVDPNNFREEMNLAVAGLSGLSGGVPAQAVKRIQSGYQAAIPRYIEVVQSGRNPKEAEAIIFDPLRNEAKSLFAEYRYRDSPIKLDDSEKSIRHRLGLAETALVSAAREKEATILPSRIPVPGVTNVTGWSLLKPSTWGADPITNISPSEVETIYPFDKEEITKADVRYQAAQAEYEKIQRELDDYLVRHKQPTIAGGGFPITTVAGSTNSFAPFKRGKFLVSPAP